MKCGVEHIYNTVADPGGHHQRAPPMGPDSFILTYKFFKM